MWKYVLAPEDEQEINVRVGARVLSVEEQREDIVLYVMLDPNEPKEKAAVWVVGTGHDVPVGVTASMFVGTAKMYGGNLMFHIFSTHTGR
jgi:hypothetical protein